MSNSKIFNPNNKEESYTYGKRGKKPNWVIEYESQFGIPESFVKESKKEQPKKQSVWKVWSLKEADYPCIIVAKTSTEALLVANKTFDIKMSSVELETLWNIIDEDTIDPKMLEKSNIWQYDKVNDCWIIRPNK